MKVILVDDNEDARYILKTVLTAAGHQVHEATNGKVALCLGRTVRPDLIISDILMPEMDGFQLCREIRKDDTFKHTPFVFYTATYTDSKDEQLASELGADRFIRKPMEGELFLQEIQAVARHVARGEIQASEPVLDEDTTYLKLYNERLIQKLEKKVFALEQEIAERKQIEDRLKTLLTEKEVLLRELYHRTKNNMYVIQSMLTLQSAFSQNHEVERIVTDIGHKIQAMALVHQKLYQASDLSQVRLQEYLPELTHLLQQSYTISPSRVTVRLDIDPVVLLIDTAIPCGLILNELLCNAFQHAFPDERNGVIHIQLTKDDQGLITLQVSDNGVGVPSGFDFHAQDTLGVQSIVMVAEHQLQGTVAFTTNHGVTCRIQFTDTHYQPRV